MSLRHVHVDVTLNRRFLTRTIFMQTTGTSYLKFNRDIIAYRHFAFFSSRRLHVTLCAQVFHFFTRTNYTSFFFCVMLPRPMFVPVAIL